MTRGHFFGNLTIKGERLQRVKIGVIGVGHLGKYHLHRLLELPQAQVVGLFDRDEKKRERVAANLGLMAWPNLKDLLRGADAVVVAVPTVSHHQVVMEALSQGLDVLVEKPIARSLKEAEEMVRVAQRERRILQVGHIERFNPAFVSLKGMGIRPRFIEAHRLSPFSPRGRDVAVVLELMIHDLDLILALVNSPPQCVEAMGVAVISDQEDIANARIGFENGCVANLTASRISAKSLRKLRIFQKDSYLSLDFIQKSLEVYRLLPLQGGEDGEKIFDLGDKSLIRRRVTNEGIDPLREELSSFLSSVASRKSPTVSGKEGLKALELALEVVEAIRCPG